MPRHTSPPPEQSAVVMSCLRRRMHCSHSIHSNHSLRNPPDKDSGCSPVLPAVPLPEGKPVHRAPVRPGSCVPCSGHRLHTVHCNHSMPSIHRPDNRSDTVDRCIPVPPSDPRLRTDTHVRSLPAPGGSPSSAPDDHPLHTPHCTGSSHSIPRLHSPDYRDFRCRSPSPRARGIPTPSGPGEQSHSGIGTESLHRNHGCTAPIPTTDPLRNPHSSNTRNDAGIHPL